jgi:hypothetical protein
MKTAALALGLTVAFAAEAGAQMQWTDNIFVNVNGGYQIISRDFESSASFTVYEEPASLTASQSLSSEFVFDASAGYRVRKNLAIGLGFSNYITEGNVDVVARIPHPLFFDQLRTVTITAPGAKHSSLAIHIMAVWVWPYTDKIDFAISGGPSIVAVKQDLLSAVNIVPETGPSFSSPTIDRITVTEQRKTTVGLNAGFDANYMINTRYGVGGAVRYVVASVDLPGLSASLTVGGFQILGGLRLRF